MELHSTSGRDVTETETFRVVELWTRHLAVVTLKMYTTLFSRNTISRRNRLISDDIYRAETGQRVTPESSDASNYHPNKQTNTGTRKTMKRSRLVLKTARRASPCQFPWLGRGIEATIVYSHRCCVLPRWNDGVPSTISARPHPFHLHTTQNTRHHSRHYHVARNFNVPSPIWQQNK